jgi:hypothetical protein
MYYSPEFSYVDGKPRNGYEWRADEWFPIPNPEYGRGRYAKEDAEAVAARFLKKFSADNPQHKITVRVVRFDLSEQEVQSRNEAGW